MQSSEGGFDCRLNTTEERRNGLEGRIRKKLTGMLQRET